MRHALALALSMSIAGCGGPASDEARHAPEPSDGPMTACKTRPEVAGQRFRAHGVFRYSQKINDGVDLATNRWVAFVSFEPWLEVGDSEVFLMGSDDLVVAEARFPPSARRAVIEARAGHGDVDVAGDFELCPLYRAREAATYVCLESAANVIARPAHNQAAPSEKKP